jgi:Carboxypeptidase regulatory-like domain/TonB-dependent Receptor Plug Domain
MHLHFLRIYLLGLALLVLSSAARAQVPATLATLRGTITDSLSGQPLPGTGLQLEGPAGSTGTATDALGRFRLGELAAGTYTLRVSGLGYGTRRQTLTLAAGETQTLMLALPAVALNLREVTVAQPRDPNQSLAAISSIDKLLRPVNSAQDLLPLVPGLVIAQHAGGGKAEQIFIRGFDVDHGTDFNVSIDGLPVNMVSHAHGQGYADMHFVIPETVDALRVYKGPYTARFGDFATAGSGEFSTKTSLENSLAKVEIGRFDTRRAVVLLDVLPAGKHLLSKQTESAYLASEYTFTNAYFDSPQHFRRFNGLGKYTGLLSDRTSLMVLGSHFTSRWDASGQVPERAVRDGQISRFGSIDNTEGGSTSRTNATAVLTTALPHDAVLRQQAYYSRYDFNLYSNFTFFLENPEQGDQIRQTDGRNIYGYTGTYERTGRLGSRALCSTFGLGTRIDDVDVALRNAVKRQVTGTIVSGRVFEQNLNAYLDETLTLTDQLTLNAALRADYFVFRFQGEQGTEVSGRATKARISPKLNLYYDLTANTQLFVRSGLGFHSNDARAVVVNRGDSLAALPRAIGYEVGSTFKPLPALVVNAAFWALHLQDELVYVGDGGFTESAGRTRRFGADVALRYQLSRVLFADVDLNYARGRLVGAPKGENYIPLAPSFTTVGGLTLKQPRGLSASLRYRHLNTRPANEDNSVRAQGYFLLDAVASYAVGCFVFGATAENLLNVAWNQAQFDTLSRLPGEPAEGVSELHYTPGTSFFIKGSVSVLF